MLYFRIKAAISKRSEAGGVPPLGPGQSGKNYLKKKEISRAIWAQIDIMGGDGSWPFHPQKLFFTVSCPGVISGHIAPSGFDLR